MNASTSNSSGSSNRTIVPFKSYASSATSPSSSLTAANYYGPNYNTVSVRYEHVGLPFGFDLKKINTIEREKKNTNDYVFTKYLEDVRQIDVLMLITHVVHSHPDYAAIRRPTFAQHQCALTIGGLPDGFDPRVYSALKEEGSVDSLKQAEEMYNAVVRYDEHICCNACAHVALCQLYRKHAAHFKSLKFKVIRRLTNMRRCIGGLLTLIRWFALPVQIVKDVTCIQYYPHHLQSLMLLQQSALRSMMIFLGDLRPAALTTVENVYYEDLVHVATLAQMSVIDTLILAGFTNINVSNRISVRLPTPFLASPNVTHFGLTHMITTKDSTIKTLAEGTMSYMSILKLFVEGVDVNTVGSLYVPCVEVLTRLLDNVATLGNVTPAELALLSTYDKQLHTMATVIRNNQVASDFLNNGTIKVFGRDIGIGFVKLVSCQTARGFEPVELPYPFVSNGSYCLQSFSSLLNMATMSLLNDFLSVKLGEILEEKKAVDIVWGLEFQTYSGFGFFPKVEIVRGAAIMETESAGISASAEDPEALLLAMNAAFANITRDIVTSSITRSNLNYTEACVNNGYDVSSSRPPRRVNTVEVSI